MLRQEFKKHKLKFKTSCSSYKCLYLQINSNYEFRLILFIYNKLGTSIFSMHKKLHLH